jgi:subtilisin family serine protease
MADIAVVFSAGNRGLVGPSSSVSPANNPEPVAVGMIDEFSIIDPDSSRGPSTCDSAIYPELVAPGVAVRTTDLSFGGAPVYAEVDGTSFAAPHVAGAMALLRSALEVSVGDLEAALVASAQDLGLGGPDNDYGNGLVDVAAAYQLLKCPAGSPDADGDGIADACDNCINHANADQRDSNGDGYGNRCDTDLNNNNITNSLDVGLLRSVWLSAAPHANPVGDDADFNGDGVVNSLDVGILRQFWLQPPGPSCCATLP